MSKRQQLQDLRKETLSSIKGILLKHNRRRIEITDLTEGYSPIVIEDANNENNTFTLDRVEICLDEQGNERLSFDASSSNDSTTFIDTEVGLDALIDIEEFLTDWEDEIEDGPEGGELSEVQKETIAELAGKYLSPVFTDNVERAQIVDAILPLVYSRVETDADWSNLDYTEVVDADVEIAIQEELAHIILNATAT